MRPSLSSSALPIAEYCIALRKRASERRKSSVMRSAIWRARDSVCASTRAMPYSSSAVKMPSANMLRRPSMRGTACSIGGDSYSIRQVRP